MKRILLLASILLFTGTVFAADSTATHTSFWKRWNSFWTKVDKTSTDIDSKIVAEQQKYEKAKAEREKKILEQQQKREAEYNARQKKLEEKREQLRKLLEE